MIDSLGIMTKGYESGHYQPYFIDCRLFTDTNLFLLAESSPYESGNRVRDCEKEHGAMGINMLGGQSFPPKIQLPLELKIGNLYILWGANRG